MSKQSVQIIIGLASISVFLNLLLWFGWCYDSNLNNQDVREACYASFHIGKSVATNGTFPTRAEIEALPTRLLLQPKRDEKNIAIYRFGMFGQKTLEISIGADQQLAIKAN